jgi:hypothetical protein
MTKEDDEEHVPLVTTVSSCEEEESPLERPQGIEMLDIDCSDSSQRVSTSPTLTLTPSFRTDVESLRGVAVLAVLVYHLDPMGFWYGLLFHSGSCVLLLPTVLVLRVLMSSSQYLVGAPPSVSLCRLR